VTGIHSLSSQQLPYPKEGKGKEEGSENPFQLYLPYAHLKRKVVKIREKGRRGKARSPFLYFSPFYVSKEGKGNWGEVIK